MLSLVMGPDPIFKKKAIAVDVVDDGIRQLVGDMFDVLYSAEGVGIGANMVGVLKRIVVIDLQTGGIKAPLAMINPEVTQQSDETQTFDEASLSFPGISAKITRPKVITVSYLDEQGKAQVLDAEGWLATVIQHEVDYLDGVIYLDHISKIKRDMLIKKMLKAR